MPFKIYFLFYIKNKVYFLSYIKNSQNNNLKNKKYINYFIKIINLGATNGPKGWNGLSQ